MVLKSARGPRRMETTLLSINTESGLWRVLLKRRERRKVQLESSVPKTMPAVCENTTVSGSSRCFGSHQKNQQAPTGSAGQSFGVS